MIADQTNIICAHMGNNVCEDLKVPRKKHEQGFNGSCPGTIQTAHRGCSMWTSACVSNEEPHMAGNVLNCEGERSLDQSEVFKKVGFFFHIIYHKRKSFYSPMLHILCNHIRPQLICNSNHPCKHLALILSAYTQARSYHWGHRGHVLWIVSGNLWNEITCKITVVTHKLHIVIILRQVV